MKIRDFGPVAAPATTSPESVHDIEDSLQDKVDFQSAESMDASDPPSHTVTTGTAASENLMNDQRIKPGRPISPSAGPA